MPCKPRPLLLILSTMPSTESRQVPVVLIASYIAPELVERISAAHPGVELIYRPELVPAPRHASDHVGQPLVRSAEQENEWRGLLGRADILFDFDWTHLEELPELAPQLRWLQSSGSGIGPMIERLGYKERLPEMIITRASGVHAQPLSEFCLMVMLMHSRNFAAMVRQQANREWTRFSGSDLAGRTVAVVGLGAIGQRLVGMCAALGLEVIGIGHGNDPSRYGDLPLDEYLPSSRLDEVLPRVDYLVLVVPHTPETEGMLSAERLAMLPRGAVLINIGRGALIDEPALVEALDSGHLAGAGLDVFATEPLPESSPLWSMPNVLVSPHSAGNSDRENARLTDLFIDNLGRFLAGRPMRNLLG